MNDERMDNDTKLRQALSRLRNLTIQSGTYKAWLGGDFQSVQFINSESLTLGKGREMTVDMWSGSQQNVIGDWQDSVAVALVMTLHRTIQPQIDFLVYAIAALTEVEADAPKLPPAVFYALALADSILEAK